jgi:amino acid transporter
LKLNQLVLFGLVLLAPVTVFSSYGPVAEMSNNRLPLAYLIATIAMAFTAMSYGKLARKLPFSGSAYTYIQQTFGGELGFMTGWILILDYLLFPMINFMLVGAYLNRAFPFIPVWVLIVVPIVVTYVLNVVGVHFVSHVNIAIVALSLGIIVAFFVAGVAFVGIDGIQSAPFVPFTIGGDMSGVYTGAAILSLSFLGFDAVATLAEDSVNPRRHIPRAMVLTTVFGGLIFIAATWIGALVWPTGEPFVNVNAAGAEVMVRAGGDVLASVFTWVYITGAFGLGMATQVSVTRVVYAMGRDGVLPRPLGRLSHRRTPHVAALVVAAISLVGVFLPLAEVFSVVSFGALVAFSLVNVAVIKQYLWPAEGRTHRPTAREWFVNGALPAVGFALTAWLWTSLSQSAYVVGGAWAIGGFIILAMVTHGFRRRAPKMDFSKVPISA